MKSLAAKGAGKIWTESGPSLLEALTDREARHLDANLFPNDGSFMKTSQISVFCNVFDLGDPGPILRELWPRQINTIVDRRNAIAHGRETPEAIGRDLTYNDLMELIRLWEARWVDFLDWTESKGDHCSTFALGTK